MAAKKRILSETMGPLLYKFIDMKLAQTKKWGWPIPPVAVAVAAARDAVAAAQDRLLFQWNPA
eukprot:scaffold16309_cov116-Skeletonema_marinoi.AAC.5